MARTAPLSHEALVAAAEELAPVLAASAREAEIARRPLDSVIDAVRESGLFPLLVPKMHGGHEADIDTFYEVVLTLSRADPAMGWLIGFYIEHNYWLCGTEESFQDELFAEANYHLSPGTLNPGAGSATRVDGGFRLDGRWRWGTGVVHANWVMVGGMLDGDDTALGPVFFVVPRDEVDTVDTWHTLGMCATGSWDIVVNDVFVPENRIISMLGLLNADAPALKRHSGPMFSTPLVPVLGFAVCVPILGAAQMALNAYQDTVKAKIASGNPGMGGPARHAGKPAVAARAALTIEAAEALQRSVLADVMAQRNTASLTTRSAWLTRMAHSAFMCRQAVQDISSVTGASGAFLDHPVQRALRDITTAANHIVFDSEVCYGDYGRILLDQPIQNVLV